MSSFLAQAAVEEPKGSVFWIQNKSSVGVASYSKNTDHWRLLSAGCPETSYYWSAVGVGLRPWTVSGKVIPPQLYLSVDIFFWASAIIVSLWKLRICILFRWKQTTSSETQGRPAVLFRSIFSYWFPRGNAVEVDDGGNKEWNYYLKTTHSDRLYLHYVMDTFDKVWINKYWKHK